MGQKIYGSVHIVERHVRKGDIQIPAVTLVRKVVEQAASDYDLPLVDEPDLHSLVVAIGGDGTMLGAMRTAVEAGATAVGINMGRVGFLTDFSPSNSPSGMIRSAKVRERIEIDEILSTNNHPVENRMMLQVEVDWPHRCIEKFIAGNEVSVSRKYADSMIQYRMLFDDEDAGVHRANSIIAATPTGSTAYALSAGGTLMYPTARAIQLVPVAPLTLTSRPIIVSGDTTIRLEVWGECLSVRCDGNVVVSDETESDEDSPLNVVIKSHGTVRMVHSKEYNFFNTLSQKLGWIKE